MMRGTCVLWSLTAVLFGYGNGYAEDTLPALPRFTCTVTASYGYFPTYSPPPAIGSKVQIDIALRDGRTFVGEGDKLSFTANVSNKGYKFEVAFSMGEPVETASLQDLFADADRQIKELYKLAGDQGVRSIEDAAALNRKLQDVMAPIKQAADKAKTLKKKSDISASFGFSIEGDWPAGGRAAPPAAMFSAKINF